MKMWGAVACHPHVRPRQLQIQTHPLKVALPGRHFLWCQANLGQRNSLRMSSLLRPDPSS